MKNIKNRWVSLALVLMVSSVLSACGNGLATNGTTAGYQQVDRLGRPAINEGLVISNANLNLWNTLPPSADGTSATTGIVAEVTAVQTAVIGLGVAGAPSVATIAAMFLPDVLRIDTSKTIATTASAYNGCEATAGKTPLCGGRKITDDVASITLSFLAAGDATGATANDGGLTYTTDHTAPLASFPYLVAPY